MRDGRVIEHVNWPNGFDPRDTQAHFRNQISMSVPLEHVWTWFIRYEYWSMWFPAIRPVRLVAGPPLDLDRGTVFDWQPAGLQLQSEVLEFIPGVRISWHSRGPGIEAFRWTTFVRAGGGCQVVSEETQRGWLPKLRLAIMPHATSALFQSFLNDLERVAGGDPRFWTNRLGHLMEDSG